MQSLNDYTKEQIQLEVGEDELNPDQMRMLYQKYGTMDPQLTPSEKNLIIKEARKNAGV